MEDQSTPRRSSRGEGRGAPNPGPACRLEGGHSRPQPRRRDCLPSRGSPRPSGRRPTGPTHLCGGHSGGPRGLLRDVRSAPGIRRGPGQGREGGHHREDPSDAAMARFLGKAERAAENSVARKRGKKRSRSTPAGPHPAHWARSRRLRTRLVGGMRRRTPACFGSLSLTLPEKKIVTH